MMTERADTFIAAQFQEEIDSRIVEALIRVMGKNNSQSEALISVLLNNDRFKRGIGQALSGVCVTTNTYMPW